MSRPSFACILEADQVKEGTEGPGLKGLRATGLSCGEGRTWVSLQQSREHILRRRGMRSEVLFWEETKGKRETRVRGRDHSVCVFGGQQDRRMRLGQQGSRQSPARFTRHTFGQVLIAQRKRWEHSGERPKRQERKEGRDQKNWLVTDVVSP